ncbi:MAG TPA: nicotinate-nucleotide--dimethylbenzimidazole phosphoribosyltransferase [Kofleriaceae bacterium]|jgi:nicotinate-nucleotide--dimethylbenzimidazole phosphoribosyltransferase|nr:nicotinate-nucleotide--dimethylbenzimidazole phosphoribosyltransferase [Kofleriaceae bacterium]
MSAVIRHVIASIGNASAASAEAARSRVAGAGVPMLDRLAAALAGAQHTPRPRAERRVICVVAADHAAGDPGIDLGADHPTAVAARAIADGSAALAHLARASRTPIVVVDAGVREPAHMPAIAVRLEQDIAQPVAQLEAGIAVAISLAEGDPLALLVLGALGVGSELASAGIVGAITRVAPVGLGDREAEAIGARAAADAPADAFELLARYGGPDLGVLAGMILGAASMNVAVVLDGHVTGTAALIATQLAPAARGYLVAAHRGGLTMPSALAHLELEPIFEVGLGHGEGAGGAMIVPLVDQVASLSGSDGPEPA